MISQATQQQWGQVRTEIGKEHFIFYTKPNTELRGILHRRRNRILALTFKAVVGSFEVIFELFVAGVNILEGGIDDAHLAVRPARTLPVHERGDVAIATEEAKVGLDTSADLHSAVAGRLDDDHLVLLTAGFKRLVLTELTMFRLTATTYNTRTKDRV